MNKEEILNTFLLANIPEIITQEKFDDVKKAIKELQQERDLYKEIIEEIREYIEDWLFDAGGNGASMTYEDINELLQILDKIIGDDK